jgi:transcription elongation factor GreA
MMMTNAITTVQLTQEGFDEIARELMELEEVKLPEVIRRVETARQYGDLSENAEYHSAKEDQELTETRIADLKAVIHNAVIVTTKAKAGVVGLGSEVTVSVKSSKSKKKATYHLVGEFEADPKSGKISSVSPLGKALMGKKKGDKITVEVPAGKMEYEVIEVK